MSIVYRRAPSFSEDDPILASSASLLFTAANDKLIHGLADGPERLHLYIMNAFRSLINPNEFANYPSQFIYSAFYSYYDPLSDQYPGISAGAYDGINQASVAGVTVTGNTNQGGNVESEGDIFNKFSLLPSPDPNDAYASWKYAIYQRGAYSANDSLLYSPFFEMAESHSMGMGSHPYWLRHGKSVGSYLPTPELADCDCQDNDGWYYYNFKYKWTNLNTAEVIEFPGACPPDWTKGGCDTDEYVSAIFRGPYADHVYTYGGDYYYFDKSIWLEGPYRGGGQLYKPDGLQAERLFLNPYILDYKGTANQKKNKCYDITEIAFSHDEFLKGQYLLAPAYAVLDGGSLTAVYPTQTLGPAASIASGTSTGTTTANSDFVLAGFLVQPHGLTGTTTFNAISASVVVGSYSINSDTSSYVWNYTTESMKQLQFQLTSTANFTSSAGRIDWEIAELWDYKPRHEDIYAFLRFCTAQSDSEYLLDNIGTNETQGKKIYQNYISTSAAINIHGNSAVTVHDEVINTNPLFDAARRYCNNFTRVVHCEDMVSDAQILVGYEVVGGKSILHLKRRTSNGDDMFNGIINVHATSSNGIVTTANTASWTNEWLMFANSKGYGVGIFDTDQYAKYMPYISRCVVYPPYGAAVGSQELLRFAVDYHPTWGFTDQRSWAAPELPSAYLYDGQLNRMVYDDSDYVSRDWAVGFYKSCQIYPKNYRIEEATSYVDDNGYEIVKLKFDRRFQYHDDADSSIPNDVTAWDTNAIAAQDYRTLENSIQEYLIYKTYGTNAQLKRGDSEATNRGSDPYPRYGSIFNTFYFTKLIPLPYESVDSGSCGCLNYSNTVVTPEQYVQLETVIRALSEGYIDEELSNTAACDTDFNTMFDYSYENLVFSASGGTHRSIPFLNQTDRPDKPKSYGPLGNLEITAEPLNIMANCLNLMTKVRLIMPWQLKCKYVYFQGFENKEAEEGTADCSGTSYGFAVFREYAGPEATEPVDTFAPGTPEEWKWFYCDTIAAGVELDWSTDTVRPPTMGECNGDLWRIKNWKTAVSYSFEFTDPNAVWAINEDVLELLSDNNSWGFFGSYTDIRTFYSASIYNTSAGYSGSSYCTELCNPHWVISNDPPLAYKWEEITQTSSSCAIYTGGVIDPVGYVPIGDVSVGMSTCGGNPANYNRVQCKKSGLRSIFIDVKNTRDIILNVPLT